MILNSFPLPEEAPHLLKDGVRVGSRKLVMSTFQIICFKIQKIQRKMILTMSIGKICMNDSGLLLMKKAEK